MKTKDLRIGNLVKCVSRGIEFTCKVSEVHSECIYIQSNDDSRGIKVPLQNVKPIPLTEEILLKCGFEKRKDGDYNLFNQSEVDIVLKSDFTSWTCDGINFSVTCINYLHQLQNLYYAIANQELNYDFNR